MTRPASAFSSADPRVRDVQQSANNVAHVRRENGRGRSHPTRATGIGACIRRELNNEVVTIYWLAHWISCARMLYG
jgi:hypothetical protein